MPPVLLVTEIYPPIHGGTARLFAELYGLLPAAEARVLVTPRFPDWNPLTLAGSRRYLSAVTTLRREVATRPFSQVHCARLFPEGWIAVCAGVRQPIVSWVHGEELNSIRSSRLFHALARWTRRSVLGFLASSRHASARLTAQWGVPAKRLRLLQPGVDSARFHPAAREEGARAALGWGGREVVLTVARLQKRKGHDRMIDALPRILERRPHALYAIVGDGEERAALEAQADRAGLGDRVRFHGALDESALVSAYQQCDLFALPNREVEGDFEGFGMVLLEAQACGRAVLAGASGGTGEAVRDGETGRRVDCRRPEVLADAVSALLADPERRAAMGEAGRRWMQEDFAWTSRREALRNIETGLA